MTADSALASTRNTPSQTSTELVSATHAPATGEAAAPRRRLILKRIPLDTDISPYFST